MTNRSPRERLYATFSGSDDDVEARIDRALDIGAEYFGLPIGFFTRIADGTQEIVRAVGDHHLIQSGETCPLKDAYCRQTVEIEGVLAVQDVSVSSIEGRAVETFDLGTYIGTKVVVNGSVYGTVCFADVQQRDRPFSERKELFLELLSTLIGTALERRAHDREIAARSDRLEQEKDRFRGIAENSSDILFRVGLDAEFTYVSAAVERILGYDPDALLGVPFYELVTESAVESAASAYTEMLNGDDVEGLTLDFLDCDGAVVVLEINVTRITDDGDIVGVQGVARDVTDRRERERELRIKTRAMDDAEMGISIVDPTQEGDPLIYFNRGFERITGYTAERAIGRNCRFLQGERTDPEPVARLRAAIDAGESAVVELVNYRADGTPFWNRVQLNPVLDDGDDLSHYLGFQTDITERKRTEQLVQLLNRILRHNLRNDMNAARGWADTIETADPGAAREAGARIRRICQGLIDLTGHARDLERNARRPHDPRRLAPTELIDDLTRTHREQYPHATITTRVGTDRGICAGTEVRTALSELLTNAIKHNPRPEPRVEVAVQDSGRWVEIEVIDNGDGINGMEAGVVAAGTETAMDHGSGLGLWLINWVVTRYGGSFRIAARDGDEPGTTAVARLPAIERGQSVADVTTTPTVLFR